MVRLVFIAMLVGLVQASSANISFGDPVQFKVYPNPVKNSVQLVLSENATGNFIVTNVLGETVLKERIMNGTNKNIDVSKLKSGIYFFTFKSGTETITKKILKE